MMYALFVFFTVTALSIDDGSWKLLNNGNGKSVVSLSKAWAQYKSEFGVHKMDDPSPKGVLTACRGAATTNCATQKLFNFRFTYFKKAYNYISKHNAKYHAGDVKYRLKITQFADLSLSELTTYTGGEQLGRPQNEKVDDALDMDAIEEVPTGSGADWRSSSLEIHNQGQCGSCWAFASTGMMENRIYQATGKYVQLSNQELVDCVEGCYGCMGGWSFKATNYIESYGLAAESSYAYNAYDSYKCYRNDYSRQITSGGVTAKYQTASGEKNMAKIVQYGAMTIALDVLYDFYYIADEMYQPEYNSCNSNSDMYVGAHAISVVGYTNDYWIIQNSWGETWGNNGYAYMVRGENVCNIGYWDNWSWAEIGSSVFSGGNVEKSNNSEDKKGKNHPEEKGGKNNSEEKKGKNNSGGNRGGETTTSSHEEKAPSSGNPEGASNGSPLLIAGVVLGSVVVIVVGAVCAWRFRKSLSYKTLDEPKTKAAPPTTEVVSSSFQRSEVIV